MSRESAIKLMKEMVAGEKQPTEQPQEQTAKTEVPEPVVSEETDESSEESEDTQEPTEEVAQVETANTDVPEDTLAEKVVFLEKQLRELRKKEKSKPAPQAPQAQLSVDALVANPAFVDEFLSRLGISKDDISEKLPKEQPSAPNNDAEQLKQKMLRYEVRDELNDALSKETDSNRWKLVSHFGKQAFDFAFDSIGTIADSFGRAPTAEEVLDCVEEAYREEYNQLKNKYTTLSTFFDKTEEPTKQKQKTTASVAAKKTQAAAATPVPAILTREERKERAKRIASELMR